MTIQIPDKVRLALYLIMFTIGVVTSATVAYLQAMGQSLGVLDGIMAALAVINSGVNAIAANNVPAPMGVAGEHASTD